jgi:hypothetical protein
LLGYASRACLSPVVFEKAILLPATTSLQQSSKQEVLLLLRPVLRTQFEGRFACGVQGKVRLVCVALVVVVTAVAILVVFARMGRRRTVERFSYIGPLKR